VTLPSPCPSFADVIEIQAAWAAAVHEHSRATLIDTVPSPPDIPKLEAEFVAVTWQWVGVGPVVFVTPLLPHAIDTTAIVSANSRAPTRVTMTYRYKGRSIGHGARMRGRMRYVAAIGFVIAAIATAEVGKAALTSAVPAPTCVARVDNGVRWIRVAPEREWESLDRWCAAVGPPARVDAQPARGEGAPPYAVVSWNDHVGAGDIDAFLADLRAGRLSGGRPISTFVILMQEAYRGGAEVPSQNGAALRWAGAERPPGPDGTRDDAVGTARRLGLDAVYIPSMRNGAPEVTDEDRGNAILSTLPLSDVAAIELPLERQRRVAIEATVTLRDEHGAAVPLRLVDTHFTNMVMHHLWVLSESGRARQAHALEAVIPRQGPLIVGGDFNAWFGFVDSAYRELAHGLRAPDVGDRRPTFGPLRLDHLLFRLPDGWRATVRRANSRYGSDHYPLVAEIDVANERSE